MRTEAPYRLRAIRWTCGSESLELMSISALPWIADNGLRRSWTLDVISGILPTGSTTVVVGVIRSFPVFFALLCVVEAISEEFNQFVFRKEFGLYPGIYFFHYAFELAAFRDLPKLNYKCSSHDESRIRLLALAHVKIS